MTAGAGGGSSTMPNKANPVAADALVALARLNAHAVGALYEAMVTTQERDGAAWALEWFALPQMCAATGAATRHGWRWPRGWRRIPSASPRPSPRTAA